MGTRGPSPADIGLLHIWEFEWFKAFHLLRDGQQAPESVDDSSETIDPKVADAAIELVQKQSDDEILATVPPNVLFQSPTPDVPLLTTAYRMFSADRIRQQRIAMLRSMKPRDVHARAERRQIWKALWKAQTPASAVDACRRWARLEDVIALGFTTFPAHVETNMRAFLKITTSARFPKSPAADDSRMFYLARGMAGAMVNISPMTSIQRLRNMKHDAGGPFWSHKEKRCGCSWCVGRDFGGWRI